MIRAAAKGDGPARSIFSRSYIPVVRAYFEARWRGTPLADEVDDAVQETFAECFRKNGPLTRAEAERGDFRGYLHGIVRNLDAWYEAFEVTESHALYLPPEERIVIW